MRFISDSYLYPQTPNDIVPSFPLDGHEKVLMYHPRVDPGPLVKARIDSTTGKNLISYNSKISFDENRSDLDCEVR